MYIYNSYSYIKCMHACMRVSIYIYVGLGLRCRGIYIHTPRGLSTFASCQHRYVYIYTYNITHTHTPNHSRWVYWGQRPGSTTAAPPPSRLSPLPHGASSRPRAWTRPAGCVCLGLCVCVCARAWMVVLHIKHACTCVTIVP